MNEYKIAKAQQAYSPPTLEEIIKQQADRIAELEKDRDRLFKAHSSEMVRADKQADRIAKLEKHNEALADEYAIQVNEVCRLSYEIEKLELQTKPLSDADIQQISHRYHYTYNPDYLGFARAIEERHGIK